MRTSLPLRAPAVGRYRSKAHKKVRMDAKDPEKEHVAQDTVTGAEVADTTIPPSTHTPQKRNACSSLSSPFSVNLNR